MSSASSRRRALGVLSAAPTVALLAPAPSTSWAALTDHQHPAAPLVGLVALAAWACTTWLTLLVALVWGARLPGVIGRVAACCAIRVAPAPIRGLIRVALGTTVVLSVLGGSSAYADPGPAPAPAVSSTFEWPGAAAGSPSAPAQTSGTATGSPAGAHRPHATPGLIELAPAGRRPAPGVTGGAVVHRGDSLWSIAARALGPEAAPARIAATWPQWWQANRSLIGDHPDLIHPGDHLVAPSP